MSKQLATNKLCTEVICTAPPLPCRHAASQGHIYKVRCFATVKVSQQGLNECLLLFAVTYWKYAEYSRQAHKNAGVCSTVPNLQSRLIDSRNPLPAPAPEITRYPSPSMNILGCTTVNCSHPCVGKGKYEPPLTDNPPRVARRERLRKCQDASMALASPYNSINGAAKQLT